ncbi:exonuclease SbcCD subunit D [Actinomyces radicidentis]|uniref:exonuclease SbcCD subunit D n=1 Tax=Actinomyces radicidentis TaxID=111015 RepID=UPI0026DEEED6|nr:exonuclease SbcCD subunit D [Actinomyces radicidentis]
MRILHTSDWHLGRTFHGRVLDEAQAAFADHLVELVEAESVDAVVVSGDVYDRAIPPTASVSLLDDTLARLSDRTRVVLTSGNHDSAQRLAFGSGLLREGLSIRARTAQVDRPVIIPDADGGAGLYVYALPYLDPDGARESLPPLLAARLGEGDAEAPGPLARSHEAVVSGALRLVAHDLAGRRSGGGVRVPALVMAHAFVVGGRASEDSERDIRVGGVDSVPGEVFSTLGGSAEAGAAGALDYAALGHLHRPQEIAQGTTDGAGASGPRLVYSGSPLPFSFSEADSPKSSVLLDLGPEGVTSLERVPTPAPNRAATLRGTLDELLGPLGDGHERDWVRVELTGPMPPETMARLKERFPDMLAFSWSRPAVERERGAARVTRASDPVEITERFLTRMLGRDPDDAERAVITDAYDAVRTDQEAS